MSAFKLLVMIMITIIWTEAQKIEGPIIGIDVGMTNSYVGVYKNGQVEMIPNEHGDYATASIVALSEAGELVVGKSA
jgi:heat shock protein 5